MTSRLREGSSPPRRRLSSQSGELPWVVVGLGNPGSSYECTRHNAGFRVVACLARSIGVRLGRLAPGCRGARAVWGGKPLLLVQPTTYMNNSGSAVKAALDRIGGRAAGIIVAYDDMDLEPGRLRVRPRGGHAGHKGVASVIASLGTDEFCRVRVGIGHPPPGTDPVNYVLQPFDKDEIPVVAQAISEAARACLHIIEFGVDSAMNLFNRQGGRESDEPGESASGRPGKRDGPAEPGSGIASPPS